MNKKYTLLFLMSLILISNVFSSNRIVTEKMKHFNRSSSKKITMKNRAAEAIWDHDNWNVISDVDGWIYDDLLDFYMFNYDKHPDFAIFDNTFDGYTQKIMQNVDYYEMKEDDGSGYTLTFDNGKPDVYYKSDSSEVVDYDYDDNNLVKKITYNEAESSWRNIYYVTFTYNQDNKVKIINEYYDELENGEYLNLGRDTLSYNSNGTLNEILTQKREDETSAWSTDAKETYEYNSDTIIISSYIESWESPGEMDLEGRRFEVYDNEKRMTAEWDISYSSDEDSSLGEKYEYRYSLNRDTIEIIVSEEDRDNPSLFRAYDKTVDIYNILGQLECEINYDISLSGDLETSVKSVCNYDSENKLEHILFSEWDDQLSDFVKIDSTSCSYDNLGFPDTIKSFFYDKYLNAYELRSFEDYDFPQSNAISGKNLYLLKNFSQLNISKIGSDYRFNLKGNVKESAKIYDLQGRLIAKLNPVMKNDEVIYNLNIEKLANGKICIFSIEGKNGVIRMPFILNK